MAGEATMVRSGIWRVLTETSTYVIDLDAHSVQRMPGTPELVNPEYALSELRHDNVALPLLISEVFIEPGTPMTLLVDVRGDGVVTLRRTTPVVEFHQIAITSA